MFNFVHWITTKCFSLQVFQTLVFNLKPSWNSYGNVIVLNVWIKSQNWCGSLTIFFRVISLPLSLVSIILTNSVIYLYMNITKSNVIELILLWNRTTFIDMWLRCSLSGSASTLNFSGELLSKVLSAFCTLHQTQQIQYATWHKIPYT